MSVFPSDPDAWQRKVDGAPEPELIDAFIEWWDSPMSVAEMDDDEASAAAFCSLEAVLERHGFAIVRMKPPG